MRAGPSIKILGTKTALAMMAFGFLVGAMVGYSFFYHLNYRTPEEIVDYAEDVLRNPESILAGGVMRGWTLEMAANFYFHYSFISRGLLTSELNKLCGTRKWNTQKTYEPKNLNSSISCTDICTYLTGEKGSLEGLRALEQNSASYTQYSKSQILTPPNSS